jgi:hypothetical protein
VIGKGVYGEEEVSVRAHQVISEFAWIRNDLTTIKGKRTGRQGLNWTANYELLFKFPKPG